MGSFNYQDLVKQAQDSGAATSYEPIPEGPYEVVIEKSEVSPTKKGDPMITLTLSIVEGEHKGRKLWHRMAFIPGNGVGLAINFRQLDTLGCTPMLENGATLEQVAGYVKNKRCVAKVGFGKNDYASKNEVKDILKSDSTGVSAFAVPAQAVPSGPRPF